MTPDPASRRPRAIPTISSRAAPRGVTAKLPGNIVLPVPPRTTPPAGRSSSARAARSYLEADYAPGDTFDQELFIRRLLDRPRDALAVLRSEDQRTQDEQVQRSLQQLQPVLRVWGGHITASIGMVG